MEYHMQYPTNEEIKQEKEIFVEKPIERKIIKKRKLLLFILSFSLFFIFVLIIVYYNKTENKNSLNIHNENLSDDLIINTLLKTKHGKKFIVSKLEELISTYYNDNKNNNIKNKEYNEDKTDKLISTYEQKEKNLKMVKNEQYENLNNVQFLMSNLEVVNSFYTFLKSYEKKYENSNEINKRFSIFIQNYKKIEEHNRDDNKLYKKGINKFSDLTFEEFKDKYLNLKKSDEINKLGKSANISDYNDVINKYKIGKEFDEVSFDWRDHSGITSIKDQDKCGSCWAFSVIAAVESQYLIRKKKTLSLSEQQLIDCSHKNSGCNGGYLLKAYLYVLRNKGICLYEEYPYADMQHDWCHNEKCTETYTIEGFYSIPKKNIKEAITFLGPFSVTISVSEDFINYSSGIFNGDCSENIHALLIIGYGVEDIFDKKTNKYKKVHYYILKNSWGNKWGEHGFMRILTNEDGSYMKCLLAEEAYGALIE